MEWVESDIEKAARLLWQSAASLSSSRSPWKHSFDLPPAQALFLRAANSSGFDDRDSGVLTVSALFNEADCEEWLDFSEA